MIPPTGGSVNITVSASRDCTWTATTETSWMQLNSTSGQGDATLAVTVERNELPSARSGAVSVNDQRVTISQEPRPCTYQLRASSQAIGAGGGRSSVAVETLTGCTWTANTSASWLRVLTPSGSGAGTVELEAEPNVADVRDASVSIGGERLTFTQSGAGGPQGPPQPNCAVTFNPPVISAAVGGGTHTLAINIGPACDWVATSSASWLTITSPASGRGNAALTLSSARNTGNARLATIAIGAQTAAVSQAAAPACTVTIDPPSLSFAPAVGEGRVRVTTQDGCAWSTSGGADWIQVANGSGTGSDEVRYTVAANTATSARSAALTIGGRSHTISQQAAAPTCTFDLQPTSQNFGAGSGNNQFTVNTQPGCTWTAQAAGGQDWVRVTSGSGNQTGPVTYSVAANTATSTRQTSISVNGQSFSVTQDAATPTCTFDLQPRSQNFGAGAGSNQFTVNTQPGCTWTAQAAGGQDWVTVTAGSGNQTGPVTYSVAANTGTSTRQTSISVNGQSFSVTQEAAPQPPPCSYSIDVSSRQFGPTGGEGVVRVTTGPGCAWTASSPVNWIAPPSSGGTGTGDLRYTVAPNAGGVPREATITVAGQPHRVQQQ